MAISVDDTAEAVTPVGASGGSTNVVAVAVLDGFESPPVFAAMTR
jgi:hypothetical protein